MKESTPPTQFGISQRFKIFGEQFINIAVHLTGGLNQSDKRKRKEQLDIIEQNDAWQLGLPVILSGDFNTPIEQLEHDLTTIHNLQPVFSKRERYNTEHRIQYRDRDGWEGEPQVIIRSVDSIFSTGFKIVGKSELAEDFSDFVKMGKLEEFQGMINKQQILKYKVEVGFPSKWWPSDHCPVGAVVMFDKK